MLCQACEWPASDHEIWWGAPVLVIRLPFLTPHSFGRPFKKRSCTTLRAFFENTPPKRIRQRPIFGRHHEGWSEFPPSSSGGRGQSRQGCGDSRVRRYPKSQPPSERSHSSYCTSSGRAATQRHAAFTEPSSAESTTQCKTLTCEIATQDTLKA